MELAFWGAIQVCDYAQLLGRRDLESNLFRVLVFLLVLVSLISIVASIVAVVLRGWDPVVAPVFGLGVATGSAGILLYYFSHPEQRARRQLQQFPDVLGQVDGSVSERGVVVHDCMRTLRLGPQQHLKPRVAAKGGCLRFVVQADRFLSVTSRLLESWVRGIALAGGAVGLVSSLRIWIQYYLGTQTLSWVQSG